MKWPRASVRTFAGSGHAVMVTRPEEYVDAVRSFLEEPRTTIRDTAAATGAYPPATFPLQRPSRLVRTILKSSARAYRGPPEQPQPNPVSGKFRQVWAEA